MVLRIFFLLSFFVGGLFFFPCILLAIDSEDITANEVVTASVTAADRSHMTFFEQDLRSLTVNLSDKNYLGSLDILEKIKDRIYYQQYRIMASFFPLALSDWRIKQRENELENELGDPNYGVIFNQSYVNDIGHTIEINVVNAETLIQDYNDLFNNPSLVKGMGNTKIIDQKGYKAIETVYDEAKHYEQNIVLSSTVILTFVAIGIESIDILNDFMEFVDIGSLDSYLK